MSGQLVAAIMLVVAACYAARLVLPVRLTAESGRSPSPVDRGAEVTGLLMALGMAAMWSGAVLVAVTTGVVAFTAMALLLALLWWSDGRQPTGLAAGGPVLHHVVACLAMVFMYTASDSAGAHAAGTTVGHHGGWWLIVSWVAGVYFLVAASSLGFRLGSPASRVAHSGRAAGRVTGYCDAAMSASMAAMLFTMV